ncbi:chromosome segregation ATPase [Tistlia consotensis]|uniref:Chromosome partitioning protein ParA n=1 Tax=Tistlia consotensis USBA 355 TaxID=560819 RepID=A0A1Y6BL46_9PROT|nr:AAA family ATPase [Tistlia consotensis]SMF09102.1 chromosome segregation ATPase [Tistlia consotensis USBA 355]SNR34846.1 chromosome segregation ATPase [Tistlia consotensis]
MIPESVTAARPEAGPVPLARALTPQRAGRILAIANQKGGVGKTTTTINLATALAACGKQVLIVDLDPQGNASTGLGLDPSRRKITVYDVLMGERPLPECVVNTPVPNLQIVPASVELSGAEIELVGELARENRLREALSETARAWDYILIDCPPALGLLTLNAMVAAQSVLVPLQAEFYALEGLSHLLRTIERVRRALNPELRIQGVVLTMYDKRNNLCDMVAKDVRDYLGARVYDTMIPRNVRISEAPSHGKPVLLYDFRCAGAQAYIRLARELLRREEAPPPLTAVAS